MRTIIVTVKPVHLNDIRYGKKKFEIRKSCPKELPFLALCCESGSGGKILAEFVVESPLFKAPPFWPELLDASCVSMELAEEYAGGKGVWFWDVNDMIDYCSTKGYRVRHISEFGLTQAPQSWCYVKEGAT